MKLFFGLMLMLSLSSVTACNVKDAAKSVGDAGNSVGKTVDDTINREKTK